MTEDPSESESDDEPADGNDGGETSASARDAADAEHDPFEETFIVKETEELESASEPDDESPTAGNSWLDESGIDETNRTDETERASDPTDERASDPINEQSDDDWGRIPIDLASEDDESDVPADADIQAEDDDPHRPEPSSTPVVPGDPSLEGAVFVVLGAVAMILVMFRLASVMLG